MSAGAVSWRRVALPTEHGSWAFLGEPIVLGLLVAFSPAGVLLAVAALAAFLARQPLRILALDRRRGRRHPRTRAAELLFAACVVVAAITASGAIRIAHRSPLPALAAIAPLVLTAAAFDLGMRSRHAAAELAGALALSGLAPAIALTGGEPPARAFGLGAVLVARAGPSILYVRSRLRLERSEAADRKGPVWAAVLGMLATAVLAWLGAVPWLAAAASAVLAIRAAHGLSERRIRMRTSRLGLTEVAFGLLTVIATAVGTALER